MPTGLAFWSTVAVALLLLVVTVLGRLKSPASPEAPPRALTPEERGRVRALRDGGEKIQAIKLHRELTGSGLAIAKSAVEQMPRE